MKIVLPTLLLALATLHPSSAIRGTASKSKYQERKLGKASKSKSRGNRGLDHSIHYSGNPLPTSDEMAHYTPSEFDAMDYLWIGWPRYQYSNQLRPTSDVVLEMIEALCAACQEESDDPEDIPCTKIIIQAPSNELEADAKAKIADAGFEDCIAYYETSYRDDMWIRDFGPVFTKSSTNDETVLLEFNFDFWGAPGLGTNDFVRPENNLDATIYASDDQFSDLTVVGSHLIAEGGNREFNGKGTLLMNRDVEKQRNLKMSWSIERSEDEYKRMFGVSNIVWVDGISTLDRIGEYPIEAYNENGDVVYAYNWGTGGHIDEIARFVASDTILVAQVSDKEVEKDETGLAATEQKILDKVYKQVEKAVDQDGNPFGVIAMPASPIHLMELTPDDDVWYWYEPLNKFQKTLEEGGSLYIVGATSYMNFVITNKVVLIPKYYMEGDPVYGTQEIQETDLHAKEIMEALMGDKRTVVAINPLSLNFGGGGMHCITAHQTA